MSDRQYHYSSSSTEIELQEVSADDPSDQTRSAHYHMFNRVYDQWHEATSTEKLEHEAIINFKNSTKIPR